MNNTSGSLTCALGCWLVAALGGALALALLMLLGGWTFLQAAFAAAVIFFVAGALISWLICSPLPGPAVSPGASRDSGRPAPHKAHAPEPQAAPAPARAAAAAPVAAAPALQPSKPLPGQAELAAREGVWKYEAPAAPAAQPAAQGEESQPETLSAPRGGKADDLKLLKGVGPKLEQTLQDLGFYHFDQVAKWTDAEVAWVDTRLKFKGRIQRDGWIEQAKILAAGGETEFSARNKK